MSNAAELLTKSSYCRNSKHAKCKTVECGCKCHGEAVTPEVEPVKAEIEPDNSYEGHSEGLCGDGCEWGHASPEEIAALSAPTDAQLQAQIAYAKDRGDTEEVDRVKQEIADRLDPAKAPAPKPAKAPKAPKEPKPVVKGTVDGKLSNAHKRAIRVQMVTYLAAMPVDLTGDLEGVTAEEAAGYVDTYWVKYIDPARDKARHTK